MASVAEPARAAKAHITVLTGARRTVFSALERNVSREFRATCTTIGGNLLIMRLHSVTGQYGANKSASTACQVNRIHPQTGKFPASDIAPRRGPGESP